MFEEERGRLLGGRPVSFLAPAADDMMVWDANKGIWVPRSEHIKAFATGNLTKNNNTTYADIPGMIITIPAVSSGLFYNRYDLRVAVFWTSPTGATTVKMKLVIGTIGSLQALTGQWLGTSAAGPVTINNIDADTGAYEAVFSGSGGLAVSAIFSGGVMNLTGSTTIKVQAAQAAGVAENSVFSYKSHILAHYIGTSN